MGFIGDAAALFGAGSDDAERARKILESLNAEAGHSSIDSFEEDPALRSQQMSTMGALRDIGNAQGMRLQDKVAMQQAMDESNRNEQGQRGALQQSFAARGMGGGMGDFAASLSAQQGSANRNAMAGAQYASSANERALRALQGAGQMAGQVRGEDYGVASGKAGAQDAMARFNAGQRVQKAGMQSGQATGEANAQRGMWQNLGNDVENGAKAAATAYAGGGAGAAAYDPLKDTSMTGDRFLREYDGWT